MDVHQGNTVYFMIHIIFVIVIKPQYQTYLRDNFLMIRDGDGKDAEELASSCAGIMRLVTVRIWTDYRV